MMELLGFAARTVVLISGSALLSSCFFQPGQFDSTMRVMADGRFTFTYEGEVVMSGMQQLMEMAGRADNNSEPCYDEETFEERACNETELAERAQKAERDKAIAAAMFGGVDISDPAAGAQLAATIERQTGWERVEFVEEGLFSVSFSISSRLGHDFDFPTLEGFPIANGFVSARLRDNNRLRIEAPGFSVERSGNPMTAMVMGMAGSAPQVDDSTMDDAPAQFKHESRGTFRLITDARILANNTDEGPRETAEGQVLEWAITPSTADTPMALLELTPQ